MRETKVKRLTQARLRELIDYDSETGIFTWRERILSKKRHSLRGGRVAGSIRPDGYIMIGVDRRSYQAHRLAWLYTHGYFPEQTIDHINRDPSDNRLKNLREASMSCNIKNSKVGKNNKSGVKGVYWHESMSVWIARIKTDNTYRFLGGCRSFCEAVCARLAAEQCLGWDVCDSNSSAFRYVQEMLKENGCKITKGEI